MDVFDLCDAIYSLSQNHSAIGEVFNIGSIQEISIIDLAKRIISLTNSNSKIVLTPYDSLSKLGFEDMARRVPNISKITRLLGFHPKYSLDMSLQRIVNYLSCEMSD